MPALNPYLSQRAPNPMFRLGALVHGRADIIHLEFGEPDFPTPAHIAQAAIKSIEGERQGYGPGNGLPWLRELISERVARIDRFAPSPEQIVVTAGGTGGLMGSLLCMCTPGDEVLVPDPGWPGYEGMLATAGARDVRYPLLPEAGWLPDLDALEAAVTARTRVLLINSPSNPGGAVFPRQTMEALVAFAQCHDLWLLSDECYDELIYEGEHVSPATLDTNGRVVTVGTFSKSYAMTGWRIGWVVAPPPLAPILTVATSAQVNNLPLFVQRAAATALTGPQECVAEMRAAYQQRRDLAVKLLEEHGLLEYMPQGAFYLLVPVARAADLAADVPFDSVAFAERLITERGIAVAPGGAFGSRTTRYARVSLASSPESLQQGVSGMLELART